MDVNADLLEPEDTKKEKVVTNLVSLVIVLRVILEHLWLLLVVKRPW